MRGDCSLERHAAHRATPWFVTFDTPAHGTKISVVFGILVRIVDHDVESLLSDVPQGSIQTSHQAQSRPSTSCHSGFGSSDTPAFRLHPLFLPTRHACGLICHDPTDRINFLGAVNQLDHFEHITNTVRCTGASRNRYRSITS